MNTSGAGDQGLSYLFKRIRFQRGLLFGALILCALFAFEIFNYSTTDYALGDLLGDLRFVGIRWATILAIAFCGIDFAGIARLFTPQEGANEPTEVWYLFGAWMLAATMNAMLTWWGVSLAILGHSTLGNSVMDRETLLRIVPIFVAIMVWLIRVLIIGSFSVAGDRLFSQSNLGTSAINRAASSLVERRNSATTARSIGNSRPTQAPGSVARRPTGSTAVAPSFRPASRPSAPSEANFSAPRPDPTYHPINGNNRPNSGESQNRREF